MSEYSATSHHSQTDVEQDQLKIKEKRKFQLPHVLLMMLMMMMFACLLKIGRAHV